MSTSRQRATIFRKKLGHLLEGDDNLRGIMERE